MKFLQSVYGFLANGTADSESAYHLTDSFTGIESYWAPPAE
ncbi:hypothetical protein [Domibacillus enclensis]|uniref:Uncharacterized protein n=1 Tax=Domibacillus enclensis TaxID=1017273 RepID=A0A1N6ZLE8_9BACI|nr:hypothetical protein [Domibacillus enclensis]SIR27648.1 hypothetical protein SAMN05443094_106258 [Domibacillus enclensis]